MTVLGRHGDDLGEGGCAFGPAPTYKDPSDYGVADVHQSDHLFYGPVPRRVVRVVASRDADALTGLISSPASDSGQSPSSAPSSASFPQVNADLCNPAHAPTATVTPGGPLPRWSTPGKWFVLPVTGDTMCYKVAFFDSTGRRVAQTNF